MPSILKINFRKIGVLHEFLDFLVLRFSSYLDLRKRKTERRSMWQKPKIVQDMIDNRKIGHRIDHDKH